MGVGSGSNRCESRHGLSPARVSQLRRHLRQDWEWFCGESRIEA